MNEGAALRVLSYINDTNQEHLSTLANEKPKVIVTGEAHELDEPQETEPSGNSIEVERDPLTTEQIKEFFKAVEDGSVDRLDTLFDSISNANADMTDFTESLLMAAIRNKRTKVAEYLIDQLGVNTNYTTDLIEFRTNTTIPVRERLLSCRELAYNKGMMDLVDLIDITSNNVKKSTKRFLQKRLKARLDEIHQAYLNRMRERSQRLSSQELKQRSNQSLEQQEQESTKIDLSMFNIVEENNLSTPTQQETIEPAVPSSAPRVYKSHIQETIENIKSNTEKSIDETGKKTFRFSNYTLHYRLIESPTPTPTQPSRSKSRLFSLPLLPLTTTRSTAPSIPRPKTIGGTTVNHRSTTEIPVQIPIRETRTSICRSARRVATARTISTHRSDNKSDARSIITVSSNNSQRIPPKRIRQINTNYNYIPRVPTALYNQPQLFMPVTFKSTAIGLPSNNRLLRD